MAAETGLRERKKQQTRQQIFEAAHRLFSERSFDSVTVADVARAADVSEVTVFNYYPNKEDLFFAGMQFFVEHLLEALRTRPRWLPAPTPLRPRLPASAENPPQPTSTRPVLRPAAASPSTHHPPPA